jgi:tetratricopeptide (TPR) repeat protein
MVNKAKEIENLLTREERKKARRLIIKELGKVPSDHWLLSDLAGTYYEENQYTKALEICEKAIKIAPQCPLILCNYACTLDMLGREKEAIAIWKKLLRRGEQSIAYGKDGEGICRARELLNDARYCIGKCYDYLGNLSLASQYFRTYIANRSLGITSAYNLAKVKKELTERNTVNKDNIKKIELFFKREEWKKARRLIVKELAKTPSDHWLLTRLSSTYYEENQYAKALKICEKAIKIATHCPLVLWDYAGTLDMLGREREAIQIWKKLLRRGEQRVACGKCGEGIRRARELLNDVRYRIGKCYGYLGNTSLAVKYFRNYIANRSRKIASIYNLAKVKKELAKLTDNYS